MNAFTESVAECGPAAYGSIALAGLGLVLVLVAFAIRRAPFALAAIMLALGALGVGYYGERRGNAQVIEAATHASPADRAAIVDRGGQEAHRCVQLGYGAGLPIGLVAVVALGVLGARRPRD